MKLCDTCKWRGKLPPNDAGIEYTGDRCTHKLCLWYRCPCDNINPKTCFNYKERKDEHKDN